MRTILLTTVLCALIAVPAYAADDDEPEMPTMQSVYAAIERTVPQPPPTFARTLRPADIQPVDQNRAPPAMQPPASAPAWRSSPYDALLK